jgi:hypothetical protein
MSKYAPAYKAPPPYADMDPKGEVLFITEDGKPAKWKDGMVFIATDESIASVEQNRQNGNLYASRDRHPGYWNNPTKKK